MELDQLKKLATMEADNIKNYATDDEKSKLDLDIMNSCDTHLCVYGIMTGDCESTRAVDLIKKCISGTFMFECYNDIESQIQLTPDEILDDVDHRHNFCDMWSHTHVDQYNFTPLETYISIDDNKMKEIVEIIRG